MPSTIYSIAYLPVGCSELVLDASKHRETTLCENTLLSLTRQRATKCTDFAQMYRYIVELNYYYYTLVRKNNKSVYV